MPTLKYSNQLFPTRVLLGSSTIDIVANAGSSVQFGLEDVLVYPDPVHPGQYIHYKNLSQ